MLDKFDKQLLSELQRDGKASARDLAEKTNLSVSPCWRRIRRLEESGVIEKYVAILNRKQLGLNAMAYLHVSLMDHTTQTIEKFDRLVQSEDQVIECSSITGENDFVLTLVAKDPEDLEAFIMHKILAPGIVRSSLTNFVLRNTKSNTFLPVEQA
jgi:DNA-binding Lrp family transcriptional regulator